MKRFIYSLAIAGISLGFVACDGQPKEVYSASLLRIPLAVAAGEPGDPTGLGRSWVEGGPTADTVGDRAYTRVSAPSAHCQDLFGKIDAAWDSWTNSDEITLLQQSPQAARVGEIGIQQRDLECQPKDVRQECVALANELNDLFESVKESDAYRALLQRPEIPVVRVGIEEARTVECYEDSSTPKS